MREVKSLCDVRAIIWDLDGTLYRYNELFRKSCNISAAKTAIDLGVDLSFDDAFALALKSEKEWGNSFKLFSSYGLKYEDFHHPFHKAIDSAILEKNKEMVDALESLSMPMVILTNASRHWALNTISHLEMDHLFEPAQILALEDVGYEAKAYSAKGFEKGMEILGLSSAKDILMVEDLPRNLVKAKELGMTTALVLHGQTHDAIDHADYIFDDTIELVKKIGATR